MMEIPFNKPYITGKEQVYINELMSNNHLAGDGSFTGLCHSWLEKRVSCNKALLTHSCTAALEMAALLLDIQPGDEVIMPSYTFVSTANAFVIRGAVPVFVDIRRDTLNIDEKLIEAAITPRTRAIVPVHYAGVACEMDSINNIAKHYKLSVVEDAAQAIMSSYKGHSLGSISDLATYSFHETKNIISGEGGCLLINNSDYASRADIIREKGTDRSRFLRGEVNKYNWQDLGSSYLPGELTAAFLWAQLNEAESITAARLTAWEYYHKELSSLESKELLVRPTIPKECTHNAHMYYILLPQEMNREKVIKKLKDKNIGATSHYMSLHSSPAGQKYGRAHGSLKITEHSASQIIRLPLWHGLEYSQQAQVIDALTSSIQ